MVKYYIAGSDKQNCTQSEREIKLIEKKLFDVKIMNSDNILKAARRLEEIGRDNSRSVLQMLAADLDKSVDVAKIAWEAAFREGRYDIALRLLAYIEDEAVQVDTWIADARLRIANILHENRIGLSFRRGFTISSDYMKITQNTEVLGVINPLSKYEDLPLILDACNKLALSSHDFRLILVGDGCENGNIIAKVPTRHRGAPWLIIADRVSHQIVSDYYSVIDTVISTRTEFSTNYIGHYSKNFEARAHGKKLVIARDIGNCHYPNETAGIFCYQPQDVDSLASAMIASMLDCRGNSVNAPELAREFSASITSRTTDGIEPKVHAEIKVIKLTDRPPAKRLISDLNIACVLDEFTTECLSHEVNLIPLSRDEWAAQLEISHPDFLLVESCWRGNGGEWGALSTGSGGSGKLRSLLKCCKEFGIPTVFWNKEDPPHYEKFGPIAKLFDIVFTTDMNMVGRYKSDFGITVHPLSFAAQPKIHNPKPIIPRLGKAVFAGSYYGDKPERCNDFDFIMGQIDDSGVDCDIFDRNLNRGIEKFKFPDRYQQKIKGNFLPADVWRAHKGYKYQVNMNSVKDSPTMFARRVYESLASGTPVISNDSIGVREQFGDIVIMDGVRSIADQIAELESSPSAYAGVALRGVRSVMRSHTYGHRIKTICQFLGIDADVEHPEPILAVTARTESDVHHALAKFEGQTAKRKKLFIQLENFDEAYKFLNCSDDTVSYAMKMAKGLYQDKYKFFGGSMVLLHNLEEPLIPEALEDFTYWGSQPDLRMDAKL